MHIKKSVILLGLAGSMLGLALPAAASPYATFAQYKEEASLKDFSFVNSSGSLLSISAGRKVEFAFLNSALLSLSNVDADLTFSATTSTPAVLTGSLYSEGGLTGFFTFKSTESVTVGTTVIPSGTILLRGDFTNGTISGSGGAGSVIGDTLALGSITWTSGITAINGDLLTFDPFAHNSFSFGLSNTAPSFGIGANGLLSSFKSTSVGTFDTALLKGGGGSVPEPATAGVLLLGVAFAASSRRRLRTAS